MSATGSASDKVTLKIPRPLYERLQRLIEDTGFHSVTEFAVFVLRDLASPASTPRSRSEGLSQAEVEAVRQRLRTLGYL
ncbi:MAG: CopG family transcriptional regulator [Candidatus Brocadiaceae bacterium]|nr:CopG family transcriptional regulator [Candidatus Brocadiaceae bacterium]